MQRQKDSCKDGKQFRVISYNMLADSYRHFWDHIFPYCEPETLRPERRLQLCRQEVDAFNADILALQEVDAIWYKEYWQPQFETDGYSCCFTQKASDSGEGCLLLFRKKAFRLLELTELPLSQLPRTGVVQVQMLRSHNWVLLIQPWVRCLGVYQNWKTFSQARHSSTAGSLAKSGWWRSHLGLQHTFVLCQLCKAHQSAAGSFDPHGGRNHH